MYDIRSYYVLSILVIVSELQELGFQNNLIRMLIPKGNSQNVHAVIAPEKEHKQDIVITSYSIHYTKLYECPVQENHIGQNNWKG